MDCTQTVRTPPPSGLLQRAAPSPISLPPSFADIGIPQRVLVALSLYTCPCTCLCSRPYVSMQVSTHVPIHGCAAAMLATFAQNIHVPRPHVHGHVCTHAYTHVAYTCLCTRLSTQIGISECWRPDLKRSDGSGHRFEGFKNRNVSTCAQTCAYACV